MAEPLRYHAVRKIADGGSAEVFLGEQVGSAGFKRPVVLKRIRPELYADAQYREMLIEEAHLAMGLHHSNLVEVLDVGEASGRYFLVMELVDGWTLHQVLRRARDAAFPLPPELAVYITAELCRALAYAHGRTQDGEPLNIVHRDVCPNNVLISMHAEVKLTDFGIAKARTRTTHTKVGMIKGKPAFMSPEQTRAEVLDARSDLFSAGTVLYALLTDTLPFPGPSDQELLVQISNTDAPSPASVRPELPKELCKVVQKAMARKREARFASAQDMLSALEQVQRSALKPAGRSELENFLRSLSAKDGMTAITRQTMPPAPVEDEPEWIDLSAEQAIVSDQTATQRAMPTFPAAPPAPRRAAWPLVVGALLVLGVVGFWLLGRASEQPPDATAPLPAGNTPAPELAAQPRPTPDEIAAAPAPSAAQTAAEPQPTPDEFAPLPEATAPQPTPDEFAALPEPAQPQKTANPAAASNTPSRSKAGGLHLSARLAPNQKVGASMVAVIFDSDPQGLVIKVDKRELGRTPATLRFKNGLTFDVWFEAKGKPPLRQWLMLTERAGALPRVTLRDPVP